MRNVARSCARLPNQSSSNFFSGNHTQRFEEAEASRGHPVAQTLQGTTSFRVTVADPQQVYGYSQSAVLDATFIAMPSKIILVIGGTGAQGGTVDVVDALLKPADVDICLPTWSVS